MGIPSFYGWLVRRFPGIVSASPLTDGFDNLYLDMNSIIHPCFHPDEHSSRSREEIFQAVTDRIDELVQTARPRRLLYLAVDGVAPRAKMNQQRARRFVAARERAEAAGEEDKIRLKFAGTGRSLPPAGEKRPDSNVITPGTRFMEELSERLRRFVAERCSGDWRGLHVILSDSTAAGEGEHKIMDFIRRLKYGTSACHDPATSHCLYGADADLILLALATHEQNFSILREAPDWENKQQQQQEDQNHGVRMEFLHLPLLRGSLIDNMLIQSPPFEIDYERVIDDFVFMCCLIGNDFLPHIPSLIINDGAVEWMMNCYKNSFSDLGGYLTCHGQLNMPGVARFFKLIAAAEESFVAKKIGKLQRPRRRRFRRGRYWPAAAQGEVNQAEAEISLETDDVCACSEQEPDDDDQPPDTSRRSKTCSSVEIVQGGNVGRGDNETELRIEAEAVVAEGDTAVKETEVFTEVHCQSTTEQDAAVLESVDLVVPGDVTMESAERDDTPEGEEQRNLAELRTQVNFRLRRNLNRVMNQQRGDDKKARELSFSNWKTRYYTVKLGLGDQDDTQEQQSSMAGKYLEGLAWMLAYYYRGICSWQWFYPFYYAPFASDLADISFSDGFEFDLGQPLKPLQQLMAVLPPQSSAALPACYARLMLDSGPPVADFYPATFEVDYSGVNKAWKGVVKLPFVDEQRLVAATEAVEGLLSEDERRRNSFGDEQHFEWQGKDEMLLTDQGITG